MRVLLASVADVVTGERVVHVDAERAGDFQPNLVHSLLAEEGEGCSAAAETQPLDVRPPLTVAETAHICSHPFFDRRVERALAAAGANYVPQPKTAAQQRFQLLVVAQSRSVDRRRQGNRRVVLAPIAILDVAAVTEPIADDPPKRIPGKAVVLGFLQRLH